MPKLNIIELIKQRLVLMDGAMGTQLIERGMQKGDCPEMWNLERADDLREIHEKYFNAGADVATTNTFGANGVKLKSYNLQDRVGELNKAAVEIAKSVCPPDCYIGGDIGPTGIFLPPVGEGNIEEFYDAYLEQAKILAEAGVDFIIIETQYDLREAVQAVKAAKTTGLPVFITLTFDKKKRGFFTIMGDRADKAVKTLEEAGADVVGANCTLGSEDYLELLKEMKKGTSLPVLVQPNAGQPEMVDGKAQYGETAEKFAANVKKLVDAGADVIGSCCGSTPEFTAKLAQWK